MIRQLAVCAALLIAACAPLEEVDPERPALGQFRLGHNIAVAEDARRGPVSRAFTETEIEAALQNATAARLRGYDGDGLYHLTMRVMGVTLAEPGIPAVYAAKPALLVEVSVFDNDTRARLNDSPLEVLATGTATSPLALLGSGNVRPAEEQLAALSDDAARRIEAWLALNAAWFAPREGQVRVPYDATTKAPDLTTDTPAPEPQPAL